MMKKISKQVLTAVCCTGLLAVGLGGIALAQSPTILLGSSRTEQEELSQDVNRQENIQMDALCIWGKVLGVEEGRIHIDNQSGNSFQGEVVLNISDETSRVLDAVNGYPVQLTDIQEGEVIYAYIGSAMTMSLPPMTTANMVLCKIPADFKVPDYAEVKDMQRHEDGNWTLTAASGKEYHIPADCQALPFLTRNIVTLEDITQSDTCLIWSDEEGNGQKIVLFPRELPQTLE